MTWAAVSDVIGRRKTFFIFTLSSLPLYYAVPSIVNSVVLTQGVVPLYVFCGTTVVALSIFGGVYAILPAYQADLYGSKNVGAIHGRMLLFSSTAALVGEISSRHHFTPFVSRMSANHPMDSPFFLP